MCVLQQVIRDSDFSLLSVSSIGSTTSDYRSLFFKLLTHDQFLGAAISVACTLLVVVLFYTELQHFMTVDVVPELSVDTTFGEKLQINVDIVFHSLPCAFVSLDAMDVSGAHQLDVSHSVMKQV